MSAPSEHRSSNRRAHGTPRAPHSFFYDRVIPAIVVVLALALLIVLVLTIGALTGVIPTR